MESMGVSVMNTTTISADIECFNVILYLFIRFDVTDIIQIDRIKIEHVSSIPIIFY